MIYEPHLRRSGVYWFCLISHVNGILEVYPNAAIADVRSYQWSLEEHCHIYLVDVFDRELWSRVKWQKRRIKTFNPAFHRPDPLFHHRTAERIDCTVYAPKTQPLITKNSTLPQLHASSTRERKLRTKRSSKTVRTRMSLWHVSILNRFYWSLLVMTKSLRHLLQRRACIILQEPDRKRVWKTKTSTLMMRVSCT